MAVLSTPFTCPDGHSFTANAKLRARCPDCGKMARKSFTQATPQEPKVDPEPKSEPKVDDKPKPKQTAEPKKQIRVLRRGKPSKPRREERPMPKIKATVKASKGLVSRKKVKKSVIPIVRGKPKGNREHKVASAVGEDKPYWQKVSDQYWG